MTDPDPLTREVARRVFSKEFNSARYTFKESDDDLAPVYALLPTGERANRVFIVGTLTGTEDVGDEAEYWQGRIEDPVGTFFIYAGEHQPQVMKQLASAEPPQIVSVTGKPRPYETDDGAVNVSLRPERLGVVDSSTQRRWVAETAERTANRVQSFNPETNEYAAMALEQYETPPQVFLDSAIKALESLDVADEPA